MSQLKQKNHQFTSKLLLQNRERCLVVSKEQRQSNLIHSPKTIEENYNVKNFSSDNSKIAEMEFYLVDDLECDLVVFHPYRTLLSLCKKEANSDASSKSEEGEAEDPGIGIEEGHRYWGTGNGQLELTPAALQTAWFVFLELGSYLSY